ncbi:MAG: hypothetical protein ACN4GM_11060 [Gammaproteobacteria bacterium]
MINKILFIFLLLINQNTFAADWSGNFSILSRYYIHDPLIDSTTQKNHYPSVAGLPEFYHGWDDDQQNFTFTPFFRLDQNDKARNHSDLRELHWQKVLDDWEFRIGISKVFWGVTESRHLVDVINQSDTVENIDGEDKLGQPMLKFSSENDIGTIDFFILPGFRERTFSDVDGRLITTPVIDTDQPVYESSDEDRHIDYALRWFQVLGDWDLGLSYFTGTSREPLFTPGVRDTQPVLLPYYVLMQQFGLDLQATTDEWLWKLELIQRQWLAQDFVANTTGFEYSFIGIFDSNTDIGLVMEYLYDSRGENTTSAFEDDLMFGIRLTLNDVQSTEALFGAIIDRDTRETLLSLEASRRLSDQWKLEFELRSFQHVDSNGIFQSFRKDDYIQLDLAYYF